MEVNSSVAHRRTHMPLSLPVITKYLTHTFVETGTYQGEAVQFALQVGFKEIHSVELNASMAAGCTSRFAGNKTVTIYSGPSDKLLPTILAKVSEPVTFWLDAHSGMPNLTLAMVPIEAELKAIANAIPRIKIRAIMIDDMRLFGVDDQRRIENRLREILPSATILREPSRVSNNDILTASLSLS